MGKIILVQDIIENKITLEQARDQSIMHKGEVYAYFDEGCTRYVYANEDNTKVIKLLKSDIGINYNETEVEIYKNAKPDDKKQMAETELIHGFIEQEFVTPIKFAGKKLTIPQRLFASSCRNEVGWRENGDLVCFDLDEFKKY